LLIPSRIPPAISGFEKFANNEGKISNQKAKWINWDGKEARVGNKEHLMFSAEEERIYAQQEMVRGEDRTAHRHRREKMKAAQQRLFKEQKRNDAKIFPHEQKILVGHHRAKNPAAQSLSHERVRSHIAPDPIDCCIMHRNPLSIQSNRIIHVRKFKT
jgi:hypothetical protein